MARYKELGMIGMTEEEDAASMGDDIAFNAMKRATKDKASNLFTESEYNTLSSDKERAVHDLKAHDILQDMWNKDRNDKKFENIDFPRYLELLKPELFRERVLSREGDQKLGDFFQNVYEGDFDQFKSSAMKAVIEPRPAIPDAEAGELRPSWRDRDLKMGPGPEESPTLREGMLRKAGLGPSGKY